MLRLASKGATKFRGKFAAKILRSERLGNGGGKMRCIRAVTDMDRIWHSTHTRTADEKLLWKGHL